MRKKEYEILKNKGILSFFFKIALGSFLIIILKNKKISIILKIIRKIIVFIKNFKKSWRWRDLLGLNRITEG